MKKPRWLSLLLRSTFFGLCQHHGELKKSEVNTYCLDCGKSMCLHCWSSLSSIRRYVYQDVIRVSDLQKYVDCSKVQSFIVNGAKVVLLNPKRQTKSATPASNGLSPCGICRRMIPEPNRYCSIACKLEDSPSSPLEGGASSAVVCYRPPPSSPSSLDQDRTRPAPPESSAGRRLSKRKGIPERARFF
ncbi:unnamed protein product [Spirodela intermedia]|uniref:Uncharacterized protein n=1 Tax=Spirodela intermedia TaxID=51605 RepID=A0A7I8J5Q6_SPIIN|nr:unnamed protein product [Spirodela intermedia]CAA6664772.1 unnamed protein product [Spirodela intermedia]